MIKRGALDAIRDVKKQYKRNHNLWDINDDDIPVYGTIASQFNDPGMNNLYKHLIDLVNQKTAIELSSTYEITKEMSEKVYVIPPKRVRYLSEIAENNRAYDELLNKQIIIAEKLFVLHKSLEEIKDDGNDEANKLLQQKIDQLKLDFDARNWKTIDEWED